MNQLQVLVAKRLHELDISARRAAERSDGLVSYENLRLIVRGAHGGKISDRVAEGLSKALQVPIDRVYEAARAPRPESKWEWPARFDRLNPDQRRIVESVAAGFLAAYEQGMTDAHAV